MKISKEIIIKRLEKFGLDLDIQIKRSENGFEIILIPSDLELTNGFRIISLIGWKIVTSKLEFGPYSLPLLKSLQIAGLDKKTLSIAFAKAAIKQQNFIKIEINKSTVDIDNVSNWPEEWKNFNIELSTKPFDTSNEDLTNKFILFQQETILGIMISLLELKSVDSEIENTSQEFEILPEGAKMTVEVNKYERNIKNRTACINYYGPKCQVCDFDFERNYGTIGKGFIHVHHTTPISQLGDNYFVNPITDLITVCPNCHNMLHKKNPPFSIDELKSFLNSYND